MPVLRLSLRLPIIFMMMLFSITGLASTVMAQPADAGSLPGSEWQLVSYGTPGAETPVIADTVITLEFPAAHQVGGNAGCNQYSGTYSVEKADIAFSDIVSTMMACADEAVSQQETTYLQALQSATSYTQTDDELVLWYDNGQQHLVFVSTTSNALLNTEWKLVSYGEPDNQTPLIEGSSITLAFPSNIQIEGYGGCNGYGGSYTAEEDTISFSEVISTLMACAENGVTEQEAAYFSALNSAERYVIDSGELVIVYADGQELHFTSANPLLNTEWQFVSFAEADETTEVVGDSSLTLNFAADNTVNGNGGCNGYGGSYTVEENTISISEIVSTMMACADDEATQQESAFFQTLQAATRYEVNDGELTIWYGDEAQLHFVAVEESLVSSSWQLISYGDAANPTPAIVERSATLSFDTETEISGNTGCNGFGGSYEASGTSITFNGLIQTEIACEGVMEQEQAYIAGLTSATDYERMDDQLTIAYPDGELTFVLISDATADATSE